jgi:hypothetical protein
VKCAPGKEATIYKYLFFNHQGVLGTCHGHCVDNAFFVLFGKPYDLQSSEEIFYTIIGRLEKEE